MAFVLVLDAEVPLPVPTTLPAPHVVQDTVAPTGANSVTAPTQPADTSLPPDAPIAGAAQCPAAGQDAELAPPQADATTNGTAEPELVVAETPTPQQPNTAQQIWPMMWRAAAQSPERGGATDEPVAVEHATARPIGTVPNKIGLLTVGQITSGPARITGPQEAALAPNSLDPSHPHQMRSIGPAPAHFAPHIAPHIAQGTPPHDDGMVAPNTAVPAQRTASLPPPAPSVVAPSGVAQLTEPRPILPSTAPVASGAEMSGRPGMQVRQTTSGAAPVQSALTITSPAGDVEDPIQVTVTNTRTDIRLPQTGPAPDAPFAPQMASGYAALSTATRPADGAAPIPTTVAIRSTPSLHKGALAPPLSSGIRPAEITAKGQSSTLVLRPDQDKPAPTQTTLPDAALPDAALPDAALPDATQQLRSDIQRPETTLRPVETAPPHSPRATATHIAAQVAGVAQTQPNGTTDVTLNPKELGQVRLTLQSVDTTISVMIIAERPETAELMRRHIDSLAQEFRGLGYQDISFSFGGRQGGQGGTAPQNLFTGGHTGPQPDTPLNDPADRYLPRRAAAQNSGAGLDLRL